MALIDDFKTRFPEFDETTVDQFFPILEPVYPCYYGGDVENNACDKEAVLNLLAHLLVVQQRNSPNSVRATNSRSAGSVSVSYQAIDSGRANEGFFLTTKYGQQYLALTQHNIGAAFI